MSENKLFKLLDLNHENEAVSQTLDCDSIIDEVRSNPCSASLMYKFSCRKRRCFPLHQAIMIGAPASVISVLCFPVAVRTEYCGYTTVQLSLKYKADTGVLSLLLGSHPEALREKTSIGCYTLLHLACRYQAQEDVVSLLLKNWPGAIKEKATSDYTPLHCACKENVPTEVVRLLLETWPDNSRQKTRDGYTPLHLACFYGAQLEVVSLLLSDWLDATREKTNFGYTPLHLACEGWHKHDSPVDVVSLILNIWPGALKEKVLGLTPFNLAHSHDAPLEVLLVMLDKWLEDKMNQNSSKIEDLQRGAKGQIMEITSCLSSLFNDEIDSPSSFEIMSFFISINWSNGALFVLDRYPSAAISFEMNTTIMANFLSVVGQGCRLTTMWEVIRNEQALLAAVQYFCGNTTS